MKSLLTLIPNSDSWTKGNFAAYKIDKQYIPVGNWNKPGVNCFCFLGALWRASGKECLVDSSPTPIEAQEYYMVARAIIIEKYPERVKNDIVEEYSHEYHNYDTVLSAFNDHPSTTYEEVVGVIRETEKRLGIQ